MTKKIKTNSNQDQQKLVTRIFTGLLLVAIGSFFVFSSSWMLLLSLVAISIFICYECHHIVFQSPKNEKKQGFKNNKTIKHFISFLICLFLTLNAYLFIAYVFFYTDQLSWFFKISLCFLPLMFAVIELSFKRILFSNFSFFLRLRIGLIAGFSLPFVFVLQTISKPLVFIALSCVFLTDTMAYFGGKYFGKTPLSALSPKKTKEGAFIGSICATLLGIAYCLISQTSFLFVFIFLMCSLVSQIGDLHESLFKRCFNAKDSGSLLPGHGFYDRCDSALLGAPFFLGCYLITTYFGI